MKKVGQITIKRIGNKWAACISGNPQVLLNTFDLALEEVIKLRKKYGRRILESNIKYTSGEKRVRKKRKKKR